MAAESRNNVAGPGRFARLGTVRVRTTLAAVLVVGLALVAGSFALVTVLRNTLTDGIRDALELRAGELVSVVVAEGPPDTLAVGDVQDQVAQILDDRGRVVASSANIAGAPRIARLPSGRDGEVDLPVGTHRFLAYSLSFGSARGSFTVLVAAALEDVIEPVSTVKRLLITGSPALLFVIAVTTWFVTGRALAPVESLRTEVDGISAAELHRRVAIPRGEDEITRLARTLNRMLDRLEEAQERQRRFISDASHELRSPVASIRQHVEVALAHPDRTTMTDLAETVLAEDLRVQRIVDDLLLLARADEGTLAMGTRPIDLDDLVFEEARRLREISSVRIDTAGVSAGRVRGDAAGLARALRNLGENAARHAKQHVAFSLTTNAGTVILSVEDDGTGIPASERARVFERFVRLDDARSRDDGGTGLGLSIVAEVIRMHGGSVVASEASIGGARIEVTLPAEVDVHGPN